MSSSYSYVRNRPDLLQAALPTAINNRAQKAPVAGTLSRNAGVAESAIDRVRCSRIRTTANDIVKICALSHRRQLADVSRVPRAGTDCGGRLSPQRAGQADQRG